MANNPFDEQKTEDAAGTTWNKMKKFMKVKDNNHTLNKRTQLIKDILNN